MTERADSGLPIASASDLTLPIYLNQDHTFGLLAQLEDGFSALHTIKTATADTESSKSGIGGSIGASNVFALLGVKLTGERARETAAQQQRETSEERVHTPTSLFSQLRARLLEREFLTRVSSSKDFDALASGQFVEFRARLQRSPLVETLEWFRRVSTLAAASSSTGSNSAGKGGGARPKKRRQPALKAKSDPDVEWIDAILSDLMKGGVVEIVGNLVRAPGATALLSTKLDYYVSRSVSEIVDGEYRVMGQVTRVVRQDSADTINLLRKTSFGPLTSDKLDELLEALRDVESLGFRLPDLYTEIEGPALQLIPIGIFV